jgi:hypothetical protein
MTHEELVNDRIRSSSSHVKTKAVRASEFPNDNKSSSETGDTAKPQNAFRSRGKHLQKDRQYDPYRRKAAAEDVDRAVSDGSDRGTGNG